MLNDLVDFLKKYVFFQKVRPPAKYRHIMIIVGQLHWPPHFAQVHLDFVKVRLLSTYRTVSVNFAGRRTFHKVRALSTHTGRYPPTSSVTALLHSAVSLHIYRNLPANFVGRRTFTYTGAHLNKVRRLTI